jgi:hypothetical protein
MGFEFDKIARAAVAKPDTEKNRPALAPGAVAVIGWVKRQEEIPDACKRVGRQ